VPDLTLEELKSAMPADGLFADREWLWSPEPFQLSKGQRKTLSGLGHPLHRFQAASDEIYRQSAAGKLPEWIAEVLDAGKPTWMVEHQRERREEMPRVIRPDLLITEEGFAVSELDSVPGGIGVLAWLTQAYTKAGFDIFGGEKGMLEGFQSLLPKGGEILVSEESADYRPEMAWIADQLGENYSVTSAEEWSGGEEDVYRFFECFDWEAIPRARELAKRGGVTPPFKPHLEEKMWLALFWSPAMKKIWEKELRGSHLQRLRELIPYGWVVDPSEIPPHAALPRLEVGSWDEVGEFSQKLRRLVLKVSGFNDFDQQPWVLQEFAEAKIIEHPYFDPESGERRIMEGRVRLCPYYFVGSDGKTSLGGCLATIVPADKKKIHGMRDGILVPCI